MPDPAEFNIALPIQGYTVQRAVGPGAADESEWLVLTGWASDNSVDQYNGQFTPDCIIGMVNTVNARTFNSMEELRRADRPAPVLVDSEHSDDWDKQLGFVKRARAIYDIPPELQAKGFVPPIMEVELWCDLGLPTVQALKRSLDRGVQLGLSVFAKIKKGFKTISRSTGKVLETFAEVDLTKIAITGKPVNKNTWVATVRRSMDGVEMEQVVEQDATAPAVAPAAPVAVAEVPSVSAPTATPAALGFIPDTVAPVAAVAAIPGINAVRPPSDVPDGDGLSADAMQDIMGLMGGAAAVVARAQAPAPAPETVARAEAPVVVPAPAPETVAETVARVEVPAVAAPAPVAAVTAPDVETESLAGFDLERAATAVNLLVERAMDSRLADLRAALTPLPEFISRSEERFVALEAERNVLRSELAQKTEVLERLTTRMAEIEQLGRGRQGIMVQRAFEAAVNGGEAPAGPRPLKESMSTDEKLRTMEILSQNGRPDAALAIALGWAKSDGTIINDTLLPHRT